MYEHDNLIYHAATGSSWNSHKYIKKIGNKYIYKEDLEKAKKKLKQGEKKVSDWNKSGKTSKYDKNISDIKKNHKKVVKARKDSAKKEAMYVSASYCAGSKSLRVMTAGTLTYFSSFRACANEYS